MKPFLFSILFACSISACSQKMPCKELPQHFSTYKKAIQAVESASFKIIDELPIGKSSWIMYSRFYSCDGQFGFMIFKTNDGKVYIHNRLPVDIWMKFKTASSSGTYYVHNIKGKYRLNLD